MARYRKIVTAQGQIGWARMAPFSYGVVLSPAALAALATMTAQLTTDPGNPFILTELRCAVDSDTSTTSIVSQLLFSITDGADQRLFSNIPIPREHMFGTREYPRQLSSEVEISPADNLTIAMTNLTGGALTTNVRVTFQGYRLVGFYPIKPSED